MTQIAVKDANGVTQNLEVPLPPARAAASASRPVVLSNEDTATIGGLTETAPASDTASSGLNGRLQRVAQRLTSLIAQLPATLGIKTAANSLSITHASDDAVLVATGAQADAAWASGSGSIVALLKTLATAALSSTSSPVTIDQTTPGTTNGVSIQTPADVISFTPTLDTAAYTSGDVLFATAAITGVTRVNDGRAVLMSLTGIDKSKNKPAMTFLFYQTNVTSAAFNAANNLSDADQANLLGFINIAAGDWIDFANNSVMCKTAINLLLEAASGTTTVYVVGILNAGTPTFAASDLVFKLGVVQS